MENLSIEKTNMTPQVFLDAKTGVLSFSGRMLPIDTYTFYNPILDWVKEYVQTPRSSILVEMHVDAINTSSAKTLMIILKVLSDMEDSENIVSVKWYYEDEEDVEDWREYLSHFEFPVAYLQIDS